MSSSPRRGGAVLFPGTVPFFPGNGGALLGMASFFAEAVRSLTEAATQSRLDVHRS
ncbi:MAG: hypothetical protein ACTIIH_08605 [Brevibacterium sp.]|uniref:hypothetical protein n=1 Tax=Brevibacterium sp. TaxID=1701 RepID=UPI003F92CAD4